MEGEIPESARTWEEHTVRVLYVASNPSGAKDLGLASEITDLQKQFVPSGADPIDFAFLPALRVEDLPAELSRYRPTVLHIAAHGNTDMLALANQHGGVVPLNEEVLGTFLPLETPIHLLFINACDSDRIAGELARLGKVSMAIGSSAPITNHAARAGALAFYERLISGVSVARAFETCEKMVAALSAGTASTKLYCKGGVDPATEFLHHVPSLIVKFEKGRIQPDADDHYNFRMGVAGCPATTTHVVFVTDDESFAHKKRALEENMCLVVRTTPVRGVFWSPKSPNNPLWRAEGDHRLAAFGFKAGGGYFALESTLCRAIERRYALTRSGIIPGAVQAALQALRSKDGAELEIEIQGKRRSKHARK